MARAYTQKRSQKKKRDMMKDSVKPFQNISECLETRNRILGTYLFRHFFIQVS